MHVLKNARSAKLPRLAALLVGVAGLGLAGCNYEGGDPRKEIGADPPLPALQQYLVPPIQIARVAAWGNETPAVPQGLQVHALATGFEHPRSLYVLPNGDVLVVESNGPKPPINRPKDILTDWVTWFAGAAAKGGNRITLLRDSNGDGIPDLRTVFLDHLNSPFGVALVGNDLYVANTDAIIRYPYQEGQTGITAPGTKLTDLPGGPINHHWTKALLASPDGSKLYVGVGSNSNITENGIGAEYERAAIWEVDRASGAHRIFASGTRNPTGLAWEPETRKLWAVVNERDEIGPDLVPDYLTTSPRGGSVTDCIASIQFVSKLMITCCSWIRSPRTVGTAGAKSVRNDTRWLFNSRCTSEIISAAYSKRRSRPVGLLRPVSPGLVE